MRTKSVKILAVVMMILMTFSGTSYALEGVSDDVTARSDVIKYYLDSNYDCLYTKGEEILATVSMTDKLSNIFFAGYGIPSAYLMNEKADKNWVPLRAVADVEVLERSSPVDMNCPVVPPPTYCALDKQGNYLKPFETGYYWGFPDSIMPDSLADGTVYLTFVLGKIQKSIPIEFSFDNMDSHAKANYAYERGWLTASEYESLIEAVWAGSDAIPDQYKSDLELDPYSTVLTKVQAKSVDPLPDLSSVYYSATSDGKIRVYAYDFGGTTISTSTASAIKNVFQDYSVRTTVEARMGKSSGIPQDTSPGYTIVLFNTRDCSSGGGRTCPNGDGTARIELGKSAGKYTAMHEFAHVVQGNAYGAVLTTDNTHWWWMEGTADWVGKVDASNDHYLDRLATYQKNPYLSMDNNNGITGPTSRVYGTAAFAMYLNAQGKSIGGTFNNYTSYSYGRDAINANIVGTLNSYFTDFAKRMYRPSTQMNSIVSYATDWSEVTYQKTGTLADNATKTMTSSSISHLGVDYIRVQTSSNSARKITITLSNYGNGCQYILLKRGSSSTAWTYEVMTSSTITVSAYNTTVKELVLCVVNTTGYGQANLSYTFTVGI